MADIFDVVADPTRRALLAELLVASGRASADGGSEHGEVSVGELVGATGLSQPTVSKHLKTLREHGLVHVREDGQRRFYRIDTTPLTELDDWLGEFREEDATADEATAGANVTVLSSVRPPAGIDGSWAGIELGTRIGRAAAGTAHGALSVLQAGKARLPGRAAD